MTRNEAEHIFRAWQNYIETADRFRMLMLTPPPSFLPYPPDILEQALNLMAEKLHQAGDIQASNDVQRLMMLHLGPYYADGAGDGSSDKTALFAMRDRLDMICQDAALRETVLRNLHECQESWIAHRESR